jgi:hypothetical protein
VSGSISGPDITGTGEVKLGQKAAMLKPRQIAWALLQKNQALKGRHILSELNVE